MGGWSSEILQNAFKTPNLRDLGHQWLVQTAVSTTLRVRRAEMMHATKLVALDKGGGQLRPICVSTIWVKLLSYILLPCLEVVSKLGSRPAWFEAASNLLTRLAHLLSHEGPFSTYDGVPQEDPLSTLLFATTMTTVVRQAIATVDVPVSSVSHIDDTVLLGPPDDVASVLQELPTLLEPTGLRLQPSKT